MSRADSAIRHGHLLRELNDERAAALLRISKKLESLIEQLHGAQDVESFRAIRADALRYRWYLEVQREALGLRRHEQLDDFYPIPDAITSRGAGASD
jgi:hypothetical protein